MRFLLCFFVHIHFLYSQSYLTLTRKDLDFFYHFSSYFLLFEDGQKIFSSCFDRISQAEDFLNEIGSLTISKCFIRKFLEKEELERPVLN